MPYYVTLVHHRESEGALTDSSRTDESHGWSFILEEIGGELLCEIISANESRKTRSKWR
jgi:hypothetical protein